MCVECLRVIWRLFVEGVSCGLMYSSESADVMWLLMNCISVSVIRFHGSRCGEGCRIEIQVQYVSASDVGVICIMCMVFRVGVSWLI